MKLLINRIENGFLVKYQDETDENKIFNKYICFEVGEGEENQAQSLKSVFYFLMEYYGCYGNKYSEKRLEIKVVHGNSYECTNVDCEICEEGRQDAELELTYQAKTNEGI